MKVYVIGSLRNPRVMEVAGRLRAEGFDVFDDWMAAGPEADDYWMKYEKQRGNDMLEALGGYPAHHVFNYDLQHLRMSDAVVMVMPAGRSAFLELGWAVGAGKYAIALLEEKDPERWDVMLRFAHYITRSTNEAVGALLRRANA